MTDKKAFVLEDGKITLFIASEPKLFPKSPDISGTLKVANKELRAGLWEKDGSIKGKITITDGVANGKKKFKQVGDISLTRTGSIGAKPSHIGTAEIGLDAYEIALWTKVAKSGVTFLSGNVKKPEAGKVEVEIAVKDFASGKDDDPFA